MVKTPQRVLIVDDEPLNIKVLGQALAKSYTVLTAINAEKALQIALSDNPPDLILLDIQLPDVDGHEVCRRLKSNDATKNIPIVFITGRDGVEDEARGLELGAVDYITKPFNLPIVLARVRNQMMLKAKTDLLEQLVSIDGLTEVHNRRYFDVELQREWRRLSRNGLPLALVMIDIDHFKHFNDNYGHQEGDHCLRAVAQELQHVIRRSPDKLCRFGGEEFAVILPEIDLHKAIVFAESLRQSVQALALPHAYSPTSSTVTISLGVAVCFPDTEGSEADLIGKADQLLYQAKELGRNQVQSGWL